MTLNLLKLEREFKVWQKAFKEAPPATHPGGDFVNALVTAARASGYAAGHFEAGLLVLGSIITLALLICVALLYFRPPCS